MALYVMWARLRAETGLGFLPFPLGVESMMLLPFGSTPFRPQEIVTLISLRWSYFPGFGESYEVVTGNGLEAFKIADAGKLRERRLLVAVVIGFILSLIAGLYVLMWGMYHYGFYNINCANAGWLQSQMRVVGERMHTMFTTPTKFDLDGTIGLFAGGAVALLLGALRLRFWWWPLPPLRLPRRQLLGHARLLAMLLPGLALEIPRHPLRRPQTLPRNAPPRHRPRHGQHGGAGLAGGDRDDHAEVRRRPTCGLGSPERSEGIPAAPKCHRGRDRRSSNPVLPPFAPFLREICYPRGVDERGDA